MGTKAGSHRLCSLHPEAGVGAGTGAGAGWFRTRSSEPASGKACVQSEAPLTTHGPALVSGLTQTRGQNSTPHVLGLPRPGQPSPGSGREMLHQGDGDSFSICS